MSFIAELQRRNVIRIAVLYLVAAWIILQVADVLFPILGVPEWGLRLILGVLVLCFPLALIFSWIYEMTPEGIKREKDVDRSRSVTPQTGRKVNTLIVVLLVVAILTVVADRLIPEAAPPETARSPERVPAPAEPGQTAAEGPEQAAAAKFLSTAPEQSVAVLPFVNMSGDPDNEYFSDGLSEELLNALAGIPGLFVAARTSSFHFKGSTGDIADIARQLRVRNVLEGSVRAAGGRVRITAQLIDATNGYHLWSDTFDRTLDDVFAVQDEISLRVADALKVALLKETSSAPKRPTVNTEAYLAYLRGQQFSNEGGVKGYSKAIEQYQRAVALDPEFSQAYAGIAMAWANQFEWGNITRAEAAPKIRAAADRALAINPDLPLAWTADALAHRAAAAGTADDPRILASLERALSMDPGNVDILYWYADALAGAGRRGEAIEALQRGLARDPLSAVLHTQLGWAYQGGGRSDMAGQSFATAYELAPELPRAADGLASVARQFSRLGEAVLWQEKVIDADPGDTFSRSLMVLDYLELGDMERARAWQAVADRMDPEAPMSRSSRAVLAWMAGDQAGALAEARRYMEDGLQGSHVFTDMWIRRLLVSDAIRQGDARAAMELILRGDPEPPPPVPGEDFDYRHAARLSYLLPALALRDGAGAARDQAMALLAFADSAVEEAGWSPGQVANIRCAAAIHLAQAAEAVSHCQRELEIQGSGTFLTLHIWPLSPALTEAPRWQAFMDSVRADRAAQLATLRSSGKEPEPH
jgi:TolB-like protein/cytochrome c-type biogenesis protein CcmH/NrfG